MNLNILTVLKFVAALFRIKMFARLAGLWLCLAGFTGASRANLTAYEPFNYSSLSTGIASTATGFAGNWTCGNTPTVITGLTYASLPTANGAFSSTAGRQLVNLSAPLASGTKWISYLFNQAGNNGGNACGVYFPNGGTGLFFGFGLAPYSETQGGLGLGSVNTTGTTPLAAVNLASSFLGSYGTTYLVALKIDFNTAGTNDTITVYLNPSADAAAPGVAATYTVSTFDVGTIAGVGFQNPGGGFAIKADEIRVGDSYGEVAGYVGLPPNAPTGLNATPGANLVSLSWTAATGSPTGYNVKRSTVSGGPYTNIGTTTIPSVNYSDSVLGGQTFYYVVSATNGAGESTNSFPVSATPALGAPAAPTGLAAIAGNAQVALSWAASAFATGYTVKRSTAFGGPYSPIGNTTAPTVNYTDASGLNNGTPYYYVVAATGTGGASADTAPVSAIPVGPAPFMISIAPGVNITWFASNNVTYQVQWSSALPGTNTAWNNLGSPIAGNGATNAVFDPVGEPHAFYRVLSIQ